MRCRRGIRLGLLAVLVVGLVACRHGGRGGALPTLARIDGGTVDLASKRGQVLIVNRWASWCGPCREEIPELVEIGKKYASRGLEVYGLNDEPANVQESAARRLGIDYPLLVDPGGLGPPLASSGYIPESFLVDRDGRVAETYVGFPGRDVIEKRLGELLGEKGKSE